MSEKEILSIMKDNLILIEHSDKYKYDVYVDKEYKYKYFRSPEANYNFDIETGVMVSWGRTLKDDAVKFPAPNILDMEIDEHCTGLRNDGVTCKFCYKSNTSISRGTMTFEEFKHIIDIYPKSLTQIAIGSSACLSTNPNIWRMMEYCRENHIVPNVTLANVIDDKTADNIARYCGAVAISRYEDFDICADSIKKLTDRGMTQVNIHLLIAEEYYDRCMDTLKRAISDERLSKLNAIVFLGLKKAGRGTSFNRMSDEHFQSLIDFAVKNNIRLGFDSCSSYRAIESLGKDITNCVLDCEASLQSSYINCRSEYSPCSFMEQTPEWRHGISLKDVNSSEEFIDKVWENERTEKFRQSLLKTSCNQFNCRTCPYYEV